ncbi:MAG: endoglucanase [Fibrobacter sp.]|nr:endoglucanase [Fibrobacter sp.]
MEPVSVAIRLNTIGFLQNQEKRASIATPCTDFALISSESRKEVFRGKVSSPRLNHDTGEEIYCADFSEVTTPGGYYLYADGVGRSAPFKIGDDIYREPYRLAMQAMYLWRCGTSVSVLHNGVRFSHDACHLDDALLDYCGRPGLKENAVGGWHDAGDYNKYVVNAGITLGLLIKAWEHFRLKIEHIDHLPDSDRSLPPFLQEIKWELGWLFTMQFGDGSVSHKVSAVRFCPFIMPERENARRYFTGWGSTATADFTAIMAAASRIFKPFDAAYSRKCLDAAERSYGFLQENPEEHQPDLAGFFTGGYLTSDTDARLWAASELWETTGESIYLADFQRRAAEMNPKIDYDFNWKNVGNLAMDTFLFSKRGGKDRGLEKETESSFISVADRMVDIRNEHGYGRPLGDSYCWGGNSNLLDQVLVLNAAFRLTNDEKYVNTSLDALGFVFGRNFFCRSFVTSLGFNPPMHPHDRRSGADGVVEPWPGYLVGGPANSALDYEDVEANCRVNEIAINWNAALIYALAAFV